MLSHLHWLYRNLNVSVHYIYHYQLNEVGRLVYFYKGLGCHYAIERLEIKCWANLECSG